MHASMARGMLVLVVAAVWPGAQSVDWEYGEEFGDLILPAIDDHSVKVDLGCNYKFFGKTYTSLDLNSNGYVTFGDDLFSSFVPKPLCESPVPMIANLWSDVKLDGTGMLFYRETVLPRDTEFLANVAEFISHSFADDCGAGFEPKCAFVATWADVASYCDYYCYISDYYFRDCEVASSESKDLSDIEEDSVKNKATMRTQHSSSVARNTFQVGIVTDDKSRTYVILFYQMIDWASCWKHGRAGFSPGKKGKKKRCFELPGSGTADVAQLAQSSNVNMPGAFLYQVDGSGKAGGKISDENCQTVGRCCG